jgi:hypothetical protein
MIAGMDPRYPTGKLVIDPQLTPEKRREMVAAIGSFPAELKAAMPSAQLDTPYREGGWTARQVVHHVADSHMNAFIRFRLTLTEDNPMLKPYNESEWSKLVDSKEDPAISIQILEGLHHRWHRMLEAMTDADFARPAIHPDHGSVSNNWLLQVYAWHGRHHIGHIKLTAR